MITLNASGGSVTFTFSGNSTYLNDGVITCPVNSLALIIDESDMISFKKANSNDLFVSANIAEFGMTKNELIAWYKANMVSSGGGGGGGVTPSEVQTMIDESISGKADSSAVTEEISAAVSGYADAVAYDSNTKAVKFYHGGTGGTEVYNFDASPFLIDGMVQNVEIKSVEISGVATTCLVISFNTDAGKQDINIPISQIFDASNYYTTAQTDSAISAAVSGKADTSYVDSAVSGKADSSDVYTKSEVDNAITAATDDMATETWVGLQGYITGVDLSNYATTAYVDGAVSGKVETSAITSAVTSASTDSEIPTAKAVYDAIPTGGTGGGKAIEAGRGISVTTGATADTVAFNLPFYSNSDSDIVCGDESSHSFSGKHNNNFITGYGHYIKGALLAYGSLSYSSFFGMGNTIQNTRSSTQLNYSTVFGRNNQILNASYAFASGNENQVNNDYEFASGRYNVSSSASTSFGDSGNTLFSVGNGRLDVRHNAFEIRQNGDIYIADTNDTSTSNYYEKPMIKLQDAIGGGGSSYSAGTGIDITNDVISVTGMVATSAVTSAVTSGSTNVLTSGGAYEALGGLKLVKLTESEYAALVTKDPDVLYVVIPDPSNP